MLRVESKQVVVQFHIISTEEAEDIQLEHIILFVSSMVHLPNEFIYCMFANKPGKVILLA